MSIPLFFEAQRLEREVYVDGGLLWNLPIEVFDQDGDPSASTLGVIVREPKDVQPQKIRRFHDYAFAMLRTLIRAQERDLDSPARTAGRVVHVDDLGISPVNFNITDAQKWALVEAGRVATHGHLERCEEEARYRTSARKVVAA
jgi:NTE family protein